MAEFTEVMNVRQAALYLSVAHDTLCRHAREGNIPAFRISRRWRFKKALLDLWMERTSKTDERQKKRLPE